MAGSSFIWLVVNLFSTNIYKGYLSVFVLLLNSLHSCLEFRDQLNHVGHTKLIHVESPCILKHNVRP